MTERSRPLPQPTPARTAAAVREVSSAELLGPTKQLVIRHAGELYVLRQTSKGRLILTK